MGQNRTDFELKQRIASLPPIVRAQLTEILEEMMNGSTARNFSCNQLIVDAGFALTGAAMSIGSSGAGEDLTMYGDTAGKFAQWDADTNELLIAGDFSVRSDATTEKFSVAGATGNAIIAGSLGVNGGFSCDSTKFTVADSTGNTYIDGTLQVKGATTTQYGVGTATGVATEYGDGAMHKTVITLTAEAIGVADDTGVGQWGGLLVYTMPAGLTTIYGATTDLTLSLVDDADCTWSNPTVGTFALGLTNLTDATIAGAQEAIIAETAFSLPKVDTTASGPLKGVSTAVVVDNGTTTGGLGETKLYVNFAVIPEVAGHAAVATGCTLSGTVTVLWGSAGDN